VRVWVNEAMNYAGEVVSIAPITKDAKLSLWTREGLALPDKVLQFYEQICNDEVVTMIRWQPKAAPKSKDEVSAT
jgi:hypothetical protein